jgi:hypothetical protein
MQTKQYNPSELELQFAHALTQLKMEMEQHLPGNKIVNISTVERLDNPAVHFHLEDDDGDQHELVIKIIQKVDKLPEPPSA